MEYVNAFAVYLAMVLVYWYIAQKFFVQDEMDKDDMKFFPNMFFLWPVIMIAGISNVENSERRDEAAIGSAFVWLIGGMGFYKSLHCYMAEWKFILYYALDTVIFSIVVTVAIAILYFRSRVKEISKNDKEASDQFEGA